MTNSAENVRTDGSRTTNRTPYTGRLIITAAEMPAEISSNQLTIANASVIDRVTKEYAIEHGAGVPVESLLFCSPLSESQKLVNG